MANWKYFALLGWLLFLQGCLEIQEKIEFNPDGSGKYALSVKAVGLAPALDQVLSEDRLAEAIWLQSLDASVQAHVNKLRATEGIAAVTLHTEEFAYLITYQFSSPHALNQSLIADPQMADTAYFFTENLLERKALALPAADPPADTAKDGEFSRFLLAEGFYRADYTLPGTVLSVSNPDAYIQPGRRVATFQTDLQSLVDGTATLRNAIVYRQPSGWDLFWKKISSFFRRP